MKRPYRLMKNYGNGSALPRVNGMQGNGVETSGAMPLNLMLSNL
jgi:hypothetical protein